MLMPYFNRERDILDKVASRGWLVDEALRSGDTRKAIEQLQLMSEIDGFEEPLPLCERYRSKYEELLAEAEEEKIID